MAREIVSAIMTSDYNSDIAENYQNVGFRLAKPADLSDANIDSILAAVNARRKTAADTTPCPVSGDFSARKLKFVRRDGNSFSVSLYNKGFAITAATAIRNIVNSASAANPVSCIELIGEKWDDLMLELSSRTAAPVAGVASRVTTGAKQVQHAGKILYQYDGGEGATTTASVKVDTDVVSAAGITSPPTVIGSSWATCVGNYEPKSPCPQRSQFTTRRFIGTLLVNAGGDDFYQTTEIPNKGHETSDIRACGASLSNLASMVCLGYRGETNKRLHLLLG